MISTVSTSASPVPRALRWRPPGPVRAAAALAALVLLLLGSGAAGWAQPATPGPAAPPAVMLVDRGVFTEKGCARCHRVGGMGDGIAGPDLARIASRPGFFEIAAAMWNHLPGMRSRTREEGAEWPLLRPQEVSNVIAFLFTAQRWDVPGDRGAGAGLFASKGCDRCHAVRGRGGPAGPSLHELAPSSSPMLVAAAMWNHGSQMGEAMGAAGVVGSAFAGTQLPDIVAYIRAAGGDPNGATAPTVPGVPERGRRLFADKGCARCHALANSGAGGGPSLGPRASPPSVTELAGLLWNHGAVARADMRALGIEAPRLAGQEMADIAAYLYASYYFELAQGDARRGQRLVRDKGCLRCHSIYNRGGRQASDFATSNVVSSQVGQVSAMWNHGRLMDNAARRGGVILTKLTAQELSDITRYLAGLGEGAPKPR